MMDITFRLPDDVAKEVSRLPDRDDFVARAVAHALRSLDTTETAVGSSKWSRLAARIESRPSSLGDYADAFKKSGEEFRRNFRFKHDEP